MLDNSFIMFDRSNIPTHRLFSLSNCFGIDLIHSLIEKMLPQIDYFSVSVKSQRIVIFGIKREKQLHIREAPHLAEYETAVLIQRRHFSLSLSLSLFLSLTVRKASTIEQLPSRVL